MCSSNQETLENAPTWETLLFSLDLLLRKISMIKSPGSKYCIRKPGKYNYYQPPLNCMHVQTYKYLHSYKVYNIFVSFNSVYIFPFLVPHLHFPNFCSIPRTIPVLIFSPGFFSNNFLPSADFFKTFQT